MATWWYNRGGWQEIEDPLGWRNGEFLQDVLKRNGWNEDSEFQFGDFSTFETKIYMSLEGYHAADGFKFLVTCGGPNRFLDNIYVKDTPSLLQLMRELAPVNQLGIEQARELEDEGFLLEDDDDTFPDVEFTDES